MKTYDSARTGASLRARQLRGNATDAEKLLWRALREKLSAFMGNAEAVLDTIAAALSPSPSQPMAGPLPLPVGEGKIGV